MKQLNLWSVLIALVLAIAIPSVSATPTFNLEDSYFVQEGEDYSLNLANHKTSNNDLTMSTWTYTIGELDSDFDDGDVSLLNGILTLTEDVKVGVYQITVNISETCNNATNMTGKCIDSVATPTTDSEEVTFIVAPDDFLCEDCSCTGDVTECKGNGEDITIDVDEPESGDKFTVGEEIDFTVNVEVEEDMDIVVETTLYDLTEDKEVASYKSDTQQIDQNEDEDFEFKMKIPVDDEDIKKGHDYYVFVKAYDKGNEDESCALEWFDLSIERDDDSAIIKTINMPSTVYPGDKVTVEVTALNIGEDEQDGVSIRLQQDLLNINTVSKLFTLDQYDDKDNSYTYKFTVDIPESATPGVYSVLVEALNDDGDLYDTNDATTSKSFDIVKKLTTSDTTDTTVDTTKDSTTNTDATKTTVDTTTQTPTTKTNTAVTGSTTYLPSFSNASTLTTVFWVIGDIALLLMAIYFVKLIFFRPRI